MTGNKAAKDKFAELCGMMIDNEMLSDQNVHAVEIAAMTYSQWIKFEKLSKKSPDETALIRYAVKAKNDLFSMLKDLGLVKPQKSPPRSGRTPLKANPAGRITGQPRPKLKIARLPDVRDQPGQSSG